MRKEENDYLIKSKKDILICDLLDILRYIPVSVLFLFVLDLFFSLGEKIW